MLSADLRCSEEGPFCSPRLKCGHDPFIGTYVGDLCFLFYLLASSHFLGLGLLCQRKGAKTQAANTGEERMKHPDDKLLAGQWLFVSLAQLHSPKRFPTPETLAAVDWKYVD
ncbi:hypothetical protein Nepgr_024808 [Nepenthes gracilis]|uniref:Uncharacterized protein n=1 Tax=Nepenthes gracilis TaxID=150966 RepID=A0AAD3Y0F7_NEPGR|nr:hypothetical protein Nepgr_024808 [Nepenthes gracilis]